LNWIPESEEEFMKKLRIGIIGSGIAARELHFPALKRLENLYQITAISSPHIDHANEFASLCEKGVKTFDDHLKMMKSGLIDVVDIAIPVNFNYQTIKDAFDNGFDVICEKPIAENVQSAKQVIELCTKNPEKILYIAESQRHDPAIESIKKMISKIGKVAFFEYKLILQTKGSKYAQTEWRKSPKHVGGFLSDGGVHHVAFLNGIFGHAESVQAFVGQLSSFTDSYDTMVMNIKYENGVFGNYSVSYALDLQAENEFIIYGMEGILKLEGSKLKLIKENKIYEFEVPYVNFFEEEFKDFYNSVLTRSKSKLGDPFLALEDLEMIESGVEGKRLMN
jgi:predicted dehydrogenase